MIQLKLLLILLVTVGVANCWTWCDEPTAEMFNEVVRVMAAARLKMKKNAINKYAQYLGIHAYGSGKTRRGAVLSITGTKGTRYFGVMYSSTGIEEHFEVKDEGDHDEGKDSVRDAQTIEELKRREKSKQTAEDDLDSPFDAGEIRNAGGIEVKCVAFTRRVDNIDSAKFRIRYPKVAKGLAFPKMLPRNLSKCFILFPAYLTAIDPLYFLALIVLSPVVVPVLAGAALVGTVVDGAHALSKEFAPTVKILE